MTEVEVVEGPESDFERKRQDILESAATVFAEKGFAAGTTKEIAARLGLSQPAIYHYVGAKEDLLREIALQVGRDMLGALHRGLDAGTTPREQLEQFVREFTAALVKNRITFHVYYKEFHALPGELRSELAESERAFVDGVTGVLRQLQDAGSLPADLSPTVLAEGVIGMVSWLHRWYRPAGPLSADAIAEHFLSLLRLDAP